jgi:hypothetical protein
MNLIANFYIFLYFIYVIFGYNITTKLINNEPFEYINFDRKSSAYFSKRLLKLSQNSLLISSHFFSYPSISLYISLVMIHSVICIGYYIKWGVDDIICYSMHVLAAIPPLVYPLIYSLNDYTVDDTPILTLFVLISYYFLQNFIYIKKIRLKN